MVASGGALGSRARGLPPFIGSRHLQGGSRGKTTAWAWGTAASGVAGGKGRRGLANGERRPVRGGLARPVGVRRVATEHWVSGRRCEGWEPTVAGMPQRPGPGVPRRARARCGALTSHGGALERRVKTNSTCPSLTRFFSKYLNCSAQKFE
jgi:hypothetical protein